MLENGEFAGLLIGCAICGMLVLIILLVCRINGKKQDRIIAHIPIEDIERLRMAKFHEYKENTIFLVGTSYIYGILDHPDDKEIQLVYYDGTYNMYRFDSIHMAKNAYSFKCYTVGQFVETLHNSQPEVRFKVKEIL